MSREQIGKNGAEMAISEAKTPQLTPPMSEMSLPEIRVPAAATFVGLVAGLVMGVVVPGVPGWAGLPGWLAPVGALWLKGLQMTILPLVASLLLVGIGQTVAAARAGATVRATLALFAAVLLAGAIMAALVMPLLLDLWPIPARAAQALAQGQRHVLGLAHAVAATMMVMIGWVLALAPIGVFALAIGVAAHSGMAVIGALAHYIALVSLIGAVVMVAAYGLALIGARVPPFAFVRAILPAQAVAFSTQSSLASLPAMLAASRRMGLREETPDFVLPLAVALFRATGPAMNMAVAIYVARLMGVELSAFALCAGVAVAMMNTLGSPSLPGTISFVTAIGPIAMAMGVPVGPLALLVAVEMLPDIMRTLGNVTMDVAAVALVDRRGARRG